MGNKHAALTVPNGASMNLCAHPPRPPLSLQERRKELAKNVSKMTEDGKVAVRNVRKDALKKLDKVGAMGRAGIKYWSARNGGGAVREQGAG